MVADHDTERRTRLVTEPDAYLAPLSQPRPRASSTNCHLPISSDCLRCHRVLNARHWMMESRKYWGYRVSEHLRALLASEPVVANTRLQE